METVICRMCFEPIFNFLCIDCLGKTVSTWLSKEKSNLVKSFNSFHSKLRAYFSSDENEEKCIKCGRTTNAVLCPYCYVNEIFWWMFEKDMKLAKKFYRFFNFDFLGTGFLPTPKIRNLEGIIISEERREELEFGICENCGNVSENLERKDGRWICESCRDYL